MRGLFRSAILAGALALGFTATAPAALAVSWNNYTLGSFYDISQATDPEVRAAGRAVVFFGNATGFVISPEGHVLTNYHVYQSFGNGGTVYVEWTGAGYRRQLALSLVFANPNYDVALYKANVTGLPYLKIDTAPTFVGQDVFIVGHPNGRSQEVSFGKVLRNTVVLPHSLPSVFPSVEYSAQTWWGSSGSPVCNRAGNVVAIHWGWDANGVSTGRLAGVPMSRAVPAIPQLAQVVARWGVGGNAVAGGTTGGGTTGGVTSTGGSTGGSVATTGGSSGGATTGGSTATTYVHPGIPSLRNGRPLRHRSGSPSGSSTGGSTGGTTFRTLPVGGTANGTLQAGGSEYYQLNLATRGDLTITLQGPASADFDVAVWKWNFGTNRGTNVGTGDGRTSTERVTITDATPGTYVVVVAAYSGSGSYSVSASLAQPTGVGGTARAQATDVLAGTSDWRLYQFNSPGGTYTLSLSGPSGTDFDVYVFQGLTVDVNKVVAYGEGTTSQETFTFNAPAGSYAILVRSAAGAGQFTLTVR